MDKAEFEEKVKELLERVPEALPLWGQLGRDDPQRAIADANYEAIPPGLPHSEVNEQMDALAWMVYWLMRFGHSPQANIRREGPLSALPGTDEAWSVAKQHKKVKGLLSEVRHGVRGYEYKQGLVHLPYNGHPELCLLDGCLRLMAGLALSEFSLGTYLDPLNRYTEGGKAAPWWFGAPRHVREAARQAIRYVGNHIPPYLDPGFLTPIGVTLGDIRKYWTELSAISLYHLHVMQSKRAPSRFRFSREKLVAHLARKAEISQEAAEEITERLTMSRQYASNPGSAAVYNPQLTPLVQVEDEVFPVTPLIVPIMPHQLAMKMLQVAYPGSSSGELRRQMGDAGEEWVAALLKEKLHDDVRIATNIPVHRGTTGTGEETDLDVVAYVPGELLVIVQVKWHIMVNSQYESLYQQDRARKGRRDLEILRKRMGAGVVRAQWPPAWGNVDADKCERKWYVLTHDTMPAHDLGDSDIKMRSYILIQQLLSGDERSIRDLVETLDCPPTPVVGEPEWETVEYGDLTIRVENPRIYTDQPAPFEDIPEIARKRGIGVSTRLAVAAER